MEIIRTENLSKSYGAILAVDRVNLSIQEGEIMALLGPNGAGKTTTLMILSTLLKPSSGMARVNGFDVRSRPDRVRASIGMVFQDPSSDELLTGWENLRLHALMYDVPWPSIPDRISGVLKLVGLENRRNHLVKTYSGGMRRRLEIARGLLHEPRVLFLDEPTLGLDPQTREHIWEYIETLARDTGMTIVLTTHYMEEAERLCSRVAIIDHGAVVALDTPRALCDAIGGDTILIRGKQLAVDPIRKFPFVRALETVEDGIRLSVTEAGAHLQAILQAAGPVERVEVHPADLNDVFMYYTGKGIREGTGGVLEHIRSFARVR
ncbi:MAG TPA: ATP-binding cassette domain-containing protein [Chitinophagaceae bacterium]|nr:ATP-binding cassette domain-containing protein [Chitinophagaceae bacterium]